MSARVILHRYPVGVPIPENFGLETCTTRNPVDGEVRVAITHLSMDPFPRLRMKAISLAGPPMRLGDTVEGRGVGRIIESRHPNWQVGEWVRGELGWATDVVMPPASLERIDLALGPPERHLSVLGPSGLTAYMVAHALGAAKAGETVVIAPAAGSVGTIAGQIATLLGARVIGIGAQSQIAGMCAIGFEPVDVRTLDGLPDQVDLFIDGVGGATHDAVVAKLALRGRVVLLGFIASYNDDGPPHYGSAVPILMQRARMDGFLLADWSDHFGEALTALGGWLASGAITPVETIWRGLDQAPAAFSALFGDAPPGKQIVATEENHG